MVSRLGKSRESQVETESKIVIREILDFPITIVNKIVAKQQLAYYGNVIKKMPSYKYPKITFEGIIPGKRQRRRPPMSWMDNFKTICNTVGLVSVNIICLYEQMDLYSEVRFKVTIKVVI